MFLNPARLLLPLLLVALASCSFFKKKGTADAQAIARVNNEYLYAYDISGITKGLAKEDSLRVLKEYANSWVKKKLLLEKARENIADDDVSIAQKVEDYRETLLLYEYEKALLNQKLDTAVAEQELMTWYDKMKDNFLLSSDVYRVQFVKVKPGTESLAEFRKLITKPVRSDEDEGKISGYCRDFAMLYSLGEGTWYTQPNFTKTFPVSNFELSQMLGNRRYNEIKREDAIWFIHVLEVKREGDVSPIDFVQADLEKMIIEKRKMQLLDKTYLRVVQDGERSKAYEIYLK